MDPNPPYKGGNVLLNINGDVKKSFSDVTGEISALARLLIKDLKALEKENKYQSGSEQKKSQLYIMVHDESLKRRFNSAHLAELGSNLNISTGSYSHGQAKYRPTLYLIKLN